VFQHSIIFLRKYSGYFAIQHHEHKRIRTIWDNEPEKWFISIVDVVAVLTDSPNPRKNWSVLKQG
jgi:hypothetical protein